MSPEDVLGPGGLIAAKMPDFESRPQQVEMARAVADAIAERRHLMVEAGTGVGKSFAYLIPAIQAATQGRDCRVVISTHTINLQEQLLRKDIPFLQSVMPEDFRAVLVKGRGNYLSLRRLRVAQQRAVGLLADRVEEQQLQRIGRWSRKTLDGSRSDLDFQPTPAVWDLVESDHGNCLGRKCVDYEKCFYYQARKSIHGAEILIVNHALFFTDLALRRAGATILPDYKVVIFDEAHTLEDVAADHMVCRCRRALSSICSIAFRRTTANGDCSPTTARANPSGNSPPYARPACNSSTTYAPGSKRVSAAGGLRSRANCAFAKPESCPTSSLRSLPNFRRA